MVTSQLLFCLFLAALGAERVHELWLSNRNAAWAFARGAVEMGRGHYPVMTALHSSFFAACLAEVFLLDRAFPGALGFVALALALLTQALRYWAISTLGPRWNTRVIVLPEEPPVTGGPYRFLRHPNYLAVVLELCVVPLIHGAYLTALVFSAANAVLLFVRIRTEEAALGARWGEHFHALSRFVPSVARERGGTGT